jgi:hypothetical protein
MKIINKFHFEDHDLYIIDDPSLLVKVIDFISKHILEPLNYHKWCMTRVNSQYGVGVYTTRSKHNDMQTLPGRYAGQKVEQLIKEYEKN